MSYQATTETNVRRIEKSGGVERVIDERQPQTHTKDVSLASTDVDVTLALDQRLRGLVWYSLYDVAFSGGWRYAHRDTESGWLSIAFEFPDPQGLFDGFHFVVDGVEKAQALRPENGRVATSIWVKPGQIVTLAVAYKSRGLDEWRYVPAQGVTNLEQFRVTMKTDFAAIDFPSLTMSPSQKLRTGAGWQLDWQFAQVVTGHQVGVTVPQR